MEGVKMLTLATARGNVSSPGLIGWCISAEKTGNTAEKDGHEKYDFDT